MNECLQTWVYLSVPVMLYLGERSLRALRAGHYPVNIVKVGSKLVLPDLYWLNRTKFYAITCVNIEMRSIHTISPYMLAHGHANLCRQQSILAMSLHCI